ncbi:hypothetical protein RB595_003722 [Gaeumannomyces hyphopodioides]
MLILGGGTLAIFAIVGFLAFIWKSANDAIVETSPTPSGTIWKRLLDSERLLQVVTASTVLIRFVAGLQVGVMTQMLSSLVLERGGCSLKDLALLSLTRTETSGPFGGVMFAIWRQRGLANRVFGALLFLLLIVSGTIQFSSTLLVADISPVKVLGDYNTSNIGVALDYRYMTSYGTGKGSYWASRAPAYFRFAEDPGSAVQGEDYYDTGTTVRAFLPLDSSSQRTAMRSYAGVTSAFDARVACVRPRTHDAQNSTSPGTNSVLSLGETGLAESNSSGVWQSLRFDGSDVGVDVTLCFIDFIDRYYKTTANSTRDGHEPTPRWNIKAGEYNSSEAVRDFLGATLQRRTPEDRGLLRLHPRQGKWSAASTYVSSRLLHDMRSLVLPSRDETVSLTTANTFSSKLITVPHRGHANLFQSVMAHTGNNAALALQALFTTLMQMAYYDLLAESESDLNITATTLFSRDVVIPRKWDGFYSFCGFFAAHLVLMLVVTAIFLEETKMSFLGNAWHAVAQVVAGVPDLDVLKSTDKTDDQVERDLRRKPDHPPVFIRTSAGEQHKGKEEAEQSGYEGSQSENADSLRRVPLENTF